METNRWTMLLLDETGQLLSTVRDIDMNAIYNETILTKTHTVELWIDHQTTNWDQIITAMYAASKTAHAIKYTQPHTHILQ